MYFTFHDIKLFLFIYKHLIYEICYYQRSGKKPEIAEKNLWQCYLPVQFFTP